MKRNYYCRDCIYYEQKQPATIEKTGVCTLTGRRSQTIRLTDKACIHYISNKTLTLKT